jgi:FtsH-binding integral membrane protein
VLLRNFEKPLLTSLAVGLCDRVGYILSFVVLIGLFFTRHQFPVNLIMLGIWTIIMSYTIGVVCAAYAAAGAVRSLTVS